MIDQMIAYILAVAHVVNNLTTIFERVHPFDTNILQFNENYNDLKIQQNIQKFNFCRVVSDDVSDCKSVVCIGLTNFKTKPAMQHLRYVRYSTWENIA